MNKGQKTGVNSLLASLLLALLLSTLTLFLRSPAFHRASAASLNNGGCTVPSGLHGTIQAAVDDVACNTITVAAGTYQENLTINRSLTLQGVSANLTIIDGGGIGRAVTIEGSDVTVLMSGIRITNGNASNEEPTVNVIGRIGGGILVSNGATLYLEEARVDHNLAFSGPTRSGFGGGIGVLQGATLHGYNLELDNNVASSGANTGFGGGLAVVDSTAHLTNTQVLFNTAKPAGAGNGFGGGIYIAGATGSGEAVLYLSGSQINNNVARSSNTASASDDGRGGGLYVGESEDTRIYLTANSWRDNVARSSAANAGSGDGGAVAVVTLLATATISITDDLFIGNIANASNITTAGDSASGGAIYLDSNDVGVATNVVAELSNVDLINNTAKAGGGDAVGQGGGLYAAESSVTWLGGTISGNIGATTGSGQGGGIRLSGAPMSADGLTVLNNTATLADDAPPFKEGGGIHVSGAGGDLELKNTILASNDASTVGGLGAGLFINYGGVGLNEVGRVTHVTVADENINPSQGIYYTGSAGDRLYITNTILASHTTGIHNQGATGTVEENYTLYHNNSQNTVGSVVGNTGTFVGEPDFVNPVGGNYHIGPDSDAIDAGTDGGITVDIDGELRPTGPGFDIGADEYVAVIDDINVDSIIINGPTTGSPGIYTFTTLVEPGNATPPLIYLWDNGDTTPSSSRNLDIGVHTLTVTVTNNNGAGIATDTHTITITGDYTYRLFLPSILNR